LKKLKLNLKKKNRYEMTIEKEASRIKKNIFLRKYFFEKIFLEK